MALFFNQDWFAARMKARHLTPQVVAQALGLSAAQWRAITCDQRELRPREIIRLAQLLQATPQKIVTEAGIGTPPAVGRSDSGKTKTPRAARWAEPPAVGRLDSGKTKTPRASHWEERLAALEARVRALEEKQASPPRRPVRRKPR